MKCLFLYWKLQKYLPFRGVYRFKNPFSFIPHACPYFLEQALKIYNGHLYANLKNYFWRRFHLFFYPKRKCFVFKIFKFLCFWILQTFSQYFETFMRFTKFTFHHKWNHPKLLLMKMVYKSSLTSCQTT